MLLLHDVRALAGGFGRKEARCERAELCHGGRGAAQMRVGAMREDDGGEAEVRCVKCEDTLNVGEHEASPFLVGAPVGERHRLIVENRQESISGYDAAHGVCNQDGTDRWVDDGGGGSGGDFEVNYAGLEPARGY